jgi:hypothetical protein
VRCYVNGQREGTGPQSLSGHIYSNSEALKLGHQVAYNIRWLDGLVDEVQLYSRALSDAEVQSLYNSY